MSVPIGTVAASGDWTGLLERLRGAPAAQGLASAPPALAQALLAAPVAIAHWIAQRAPAVAAQPELRLLVIGAEVLDAVDQGRWYQLLPVLLGARLQVEVTLVGEQLEVARASPLAAVAPKLPARTHRGSLASYFADCAPRAHDLAIVFHPGFQKHQGWLSDASLAALIASGVPLIASSYGEDEQQVDRWIVECYGYEVAGAPLINPYYLDFSEPGTSIQWGHVLWCFGARVPPAGAPADAARLDRLTLLSRMVMHSIALQQPPRAAHGSMVTFTGSNGARRDLIYVFDQYFCDPADGAVLALRDGALAPCTRLPAATLAAHPGTGASDLERAIWAAAVKHAHLLLFYPDHPDEQSKEELARSMHADLTRRIDALLR